MAYNPNAPADDQFLADFPPEMREQLRAIIEDEIVNALQLRGLVPGNANGNIPISNGTVNTNLNADMVDGKDATYFAAASQIPGVATQNDDGFMSNTDKAKLDGISAGAEVNQNAFANVKVGSTTIQADAKQDTLELTAGTNITLTPDQTNDKVTVAAPNVLPLAGGTMTGTISSKLNATRGTAPSASIYNHPFQIVDNGGNRVGSVYNIYSTDKSNSLSLLVYTGQSTANTYAMLGIGIDSSGNVYTVAPTPATSSNSTNIATTAYVKSNLGSYLPLAGGTMTGLIKKNGNVVYADDAQFTRFMGGSSDTKGASLTLGGKDHSWAGHWELKAHNGTNSYILKGDTSGNLLWGSDTVVCASNLVTYSYSNISIPAHGRTSLGTLQENPSFYSAFINGTGYAYCNVTVGGSNGRAAYINNVGSSAVSGISVTLKVLHGVV